MADVGGDARRVGLKAPLNYARFALLRPEWWVEQQSRRKWFRRLIKPGDLCFDVGANAGLLTELFAELGARVIAVEPQADLASKLRDLAERHPQVQVVESALGEKPGRGQLLCDPSESQIATLDSQWIESVRASGRFDQQRWTETTEVEITTLEDLISRFGLPRFCKIDVEGSEPQVLEGLGQPIPLVSVEWTPEYSGHAGSCLMRLASLASYEFNLMVHGGWEWASSEWLDADRCLRFLDQSSSRWPIGGDLYARAVG